MPDAFMPAFYVPASIVSVEGDGQVLTNRWGVANLDGDLAFIRIASGDFTARCHGDKAQIEAFLRRSKQFNADRHRIEFFPVINMTQARAYLRGSAAA